MLSIQNPHDVLEIVTDIADLDYVTGMYANTTGKYIRWVCFAAHGPHRRYFTVSDSHTTYPIINLLDRSESLKSIDKVDLNKIVGTVALEDLVSDSFCGVLRGLGLYKALAERGILKLTDLKPVVWEQSEPDRFFKAEICYTNSLEVYEGVLVDQPLTKEEAHFAAKYWDDGKWDNGEGLYLGVVFDHLGNAVAVYRKGEQIA